MMNRISAPLAASGREHSGQAVFVLSPDDASRRDYPFTGAPLTKNTTIELPLVLFGSRVPAQRTRNPEKPFTGKEAVIARQEGH